MRHVAVFVAVVVSINCAQSNEDVGLTPAITARPTGPALVNERWQILKMAMAQDIFTIEVEVSDVLNASAVARELVDPLQLQYAELLVYVYAAGEGSGGYLPLKRIEWTDADGFSELAY